MYDFQTWIDHVTEYPYRFNVTKVSDGVEDHEPAHGSVLRPGTPVNSETMTHVEHGIAGNDMAFFILGHRLLQKWREEEELFKEFMPESGQKTLTGNGSNAFYKFPSFNGSEASVSLGTVRKNVDYQVDVYVVSYSGGDVLGVEVYNKAVNGFYLRFHGSAETVNVRYTVRGGMTE